jgi:hypothetical protein
MKAAEIKKIFSTMANPIQQKEWVRHSERMMVHSRGEFPKKLIDNNRPYEPDIIRKYRKENYREITKFPFVQAIINLQQVFSRSAVQYDIPGDFQQYLNELQCGDMRNFFSFVQSDLIWRMIEDPNGIAVVMPYGPGLTDETTQVDISIQLVFSKDIKFIDSDSVVFKTGRKQKMSDGTYADIYMLIDDEGYFSIYNFKGESKLEPLYYHGLNYCPAIVLGGYEARKNNGLIDMKFYESFFSSYAAWGDEVISTFSDHQGSYVNTAHPIREMEGEPCTNCEKGWVFDEEEQRKVVCSVCNGTAQVFPSAGPHAIMIRKKIVKDGDETTDPIPVVRYITPPVEGLKYTGDYVFSLMDKSEKSLNLLHIDAAQSGVAKEIDRENQTAQLNTIGENVYNRLVTKLLKFIYELRNIDQEFVGKINIPNTFRNRTEAELVGELDAMKKAGAPDAIISEINRQLFQRRFSGNPMLLKVFEVWSSYDFLWNKDSQEKDSMLAATLISEAEAKKSLLAYPTIYNYANLNREKFMKDSVESIIKVVDAQIQPLLPTIVPIGG